MDLALDQSCLKPILVAISMSDEILLQFLEAGIVNVGSDDSKLEKLRATAKDLAAALKKAPTRTTRWTLVAIDPEVTADDPVIVESWTALKKNWITASNTYQSTPIALLRATLLDALVQSASKDEAIAVAFANTARNMLPQMPLGGEASVWEGAIAQMEDLVDARAEAEWATPELIQVTPMTYEPPEGIKVSGGKSVVDRDTLRTKISAATSPNGGHNPNPHWMNNNQGGWAQEFSSRMADAIADTVDAVAKTSAVEPIDLGPPLTALASAVDAYVAQAFKAFSGATAGLQRRTNLLWWKEALYSASSRTSYRSMEPFAAASLMALDLFDQVPLFSPAGVSAFLNETILLLPRHSSAKALGVSKIVHQLLQEPLSRPLCDLARTLESAPEGRGPLLAILGHLNHEALTGVAFRQLTGFGDDVAMTPDEWGAHLFRELQAARATQPGVGKRTRAKG